MKFHAKTLLLVSITLSWVAIGTGLHAADPTARVYRDKVESHWLAEPGGESRRFWYRVALPGEQQEFILVDAGKGERAPAFDHVRLAAALSKQINGTVDPKALPIRSLTFSPDAKTLTLQGSGGSWALDLESYALTPAPPADGDENHLRPLLLPHPSRGGGEETTVRFVNRLGTEVDLYWLDESGAPQPYGSVAAGGEYEQHTYVGHVWVVSSKNHAPIAIFEANGKPGVAFVGGDDAPAKRPAHRRERKDEAAPERPRSPDGKWDAVVHGDNLFLRDVGTGQERQCTSDAQPRSSYARHAENNEGVDLESHPRDPAPVPAVYWSPDSLHFVALRFTPGTSRRVFLVQSSPADQIQPKLDSYPYLKPGDDVPTAKPHLFDVAMAKETPVNDALFANPWSIDGFRWNPDGSEFTFQYNQRGHQVLRILGVHAQSGTVRPIVEDLSKTFLCYSSKFLAESLDETGEIIWMSERDGWNHLYLYDAKTGTVKNQITKGEWVVRGVDQVDRAKRQVWFHAGGVNPGEDPYDVHYYRVNFDGTGLTALTGGDGTHAVQYSPDHRFLIDTWSRINLPPQNDLHRVEDGQLVCHLEAGDIGELTARGWIAPEPFVAKGRDGTTNIYGIIRRPRNFDPTKRYPVLEDIYAGPQDSFVPKGFSAYRFQDLADRGFVIVQIDGMGTSNRSKAFHDVCWKDLADAGLPDRILWIKAAAAKYPSLDLSRVGIFGTSAGGQSALRALLDHGDFYKAAVADSGCHDNRMDKIWWNEQWMGWPVDGSYARSSNVVNAYKLHGKLLLMVGEMDKNVDPASTLQVVNALIKADKDFELIDMPNAGHGVAGTPYGHRRLLDFFTRHLLNVSTP